MPNDTKGERYNIQCPSCGVVGELEANVTIPLVHDDVVYFRDEVALVNCELNDVRCSACGEGGLEVHYYEHTEVCNCAQY